MSDIDLITPDHEGIPVDDSAEPEDAEVEHAATREEVREEVSDERPEQGDA